jgi:LysR family nitrogen assimilation transcriptional regulator
VNIRHLRYFVEIVSMGSLRRASEVLYVTQSALSRAVADLEQELQCALLERSQHGVSPTPHGLALVQRARRILMDVESLRADLREQRNEPAGHVRLAMPIGVRDRLTRPLVRKLKDAYPNIRVDISDGNAHENRSAVLEGQADIAVIHELERGLPLNYQRIYVDALCLVGPRSDDFRLGKPLERSVLANRPLLLIRAPNQIRWTVDAALRRQKAKTEPAMEVSSSLLLLDLVEDGHGYTVLPESLITEAVKHRGISAARLGGMKVTWIAAWPKGKSLSRPVRIALESLLAIS